MSDEYVLEIPEMLNLESSPKRRAQAPARPWPAGTRIISADSHWLESDLWVSRFPADLRDRAPRMHFVDGGWDMVTDGKGMFPRDQLAALCGLFECAPGINDICARIADLDVEGVEKELLYPQRLFGLIVAGDMELREHIFDAYNCYMSEVCAEAPGRLYFAGIPNYWDPAQASSSVQKVKALGARALMVPLSPRKDVDGELITYNNPKMDRFWDAVQASGLPLTFHIGERFGNLKLAGEVGLHLLTERQGFRPIWGALTFGGVFDRFPGLRVIFTEAGISWVPGMLYEADALAASFGSFLQPQLAHTPSWYWRHHCYVTFMTDAPGLELLHRIGADRVLWSSDYPHPESTFGYTRSAIQAVFDSSSMTDARKILGKTALDLFRMHAA